MTKEKHIEKLQKDHNLKIHNSRNEIYNGHSIEEVYVTHKNGGSHLYCYIDGNITDRTYFGVLYTLGYREKHTGEFWPSWDD
jgi:hypothetical protein